MLAMAVLRTYLEGLRAIHLTGEATAETPYYGQLERLLNEVGKALSPAVTCVLTTKNRGAGVPDGGLFIARQAVAEAGDSALLARAPERGVMEVKGPAQDVIRVARSAQVRRYLARYGKVLVCTYRDFVVLRLDSNGEAQAGERFTLAPDEDSFWALNPKDAENAHGADFADYLKRALRGDAPLSNPADLAWFLAAYARTALKRVEDAGDMQTLATLRSALEEALGLRFEGEDGDHFFRSALVQTLFYGVFASWVFWSEQQPEQTTDRFTWRRRSGPYRCRWFACSSSNWPHPRTCRSGWTRCSTGPTTSWPAWTANYFSSASRPPGQSSTSTSRFCRRTIRSSAASSASGTRRRRSCTTWSTALTRRYARSLVSRSALPTRTSTCSIPVRAPAPTCPPSSTGS